MMDFTLEQKREILELKRLCSISKCAVCKSKISGFYYYEYGDDGNAGMLCNECEKYTPTDEDLQDDLINLYYKDVVDNS